MENRLKYLDALKGFLVICVVLGHVIDGYLESAVFLGYEVPLFLVFNVIYSFHMPLCFMVSGYLYQLSYVNITGNIKKDKVCNHIKNLVSVYVIFSVFTWGMKLLMAGAVNHTVNVLDLLLIWAIPMPTYWYLYVLIVFYLFFSVHKVREMQIKSLLWVFVIINIISNCISGSLWFQISRVAYYALFFYLGILRKKNKDFVLFQSRMCCVSGAIAILCALPFFLEGYRVSSIPIFNTIVGFGFSNVLWFVFEKIFNLILKGRGGKILCTCGINMLEIYVTHVFVVAALRLLLLKMDINIIWICIPFNTILGTALPLVCSKFTKKYGLHNILFRPYSSMKKRKI